MKLFKLLFDLFLPRRCAVCGIELNYHEEHLCLKCYADLPFTYFWKMEENPAESVFWGRCKIERVYSLFYYTNNYRRPLHLLKYKGNTPLGLYFGRMLGTHIPCNSIDYIAPVPLHWRKRVTRGYNQAEIIARGVATGIADNLTASGVAGASGILGASGAPQVIKNLLRRKRFTKTQTAKDRINRWENVRRAFEVNPKYLNRNSTLPLAGKHILLIDDVLT